MVMQCTIHLSLRSADVVGDLSVFVLSFVYYYSFYLSSALSSDDCHFYPIFPKFSMSIEVDKRTK